MFPALTPAWAAPRRLALLAAVALLAFAVQVDAASRETLGTGDTIRVSVFQNPDLTTEARLSERGAIATIERPYKRYVGAQIGIYNPRGERVGEVSHLRNKEYIFVCGSEATVARVTRRTKMAG